MINPAIQRILEQGLESRKYSACAIGIQKIGGEAVFASFGKDSLSAEAQDVHLKTKYDLASLTKVIFTTTLAAKLVEKGSIELDVPLKSHEGLGEIAELIQGTAYENCTFEDLLLHRAGFPMRAEYALICPRSSHSTKHHKEVSRELIRCTAKVSPAYDIGSKTIYSDPGFIFLAEILSIVRGDSAENIWLNDIQNPLDLLSTKHAKQFSSSDTFAVAAKNLGPGEIQDSEARYLAKLCGHAGLFGDIQDLVSFGMAWLRAYTEGTDFLGKETAQRFVDPYLESTFSDRRLGWDGVSENSSAGLISKKSIGHLGYTGTSLWIDLEKQIVVGLLTNRTLTELPDSDQFLSGEQVRSFNDFRRNVHNAVWRSMSS